MRIQRVIRQTFFILCLLSILTLSTALAFSHIWIRNAVYLLVVILAFSVSRDIKGSYLKNVIRWLPLVVFSILVVTSFTSFANHLSGGWKTVWISHRDKNQPDIYIGGQMLDAGARGYADRIVKVTPITPLLNWVTPVDTTNLNKDWVRVYEDSNPFNLKY
jgi:energy-coupling factor transporter transmembrane protein EcfT